MSLHLQDSVILITSSVPDNNRFGTGFVIHRDKRATYLLTCAHVVRDVGGQDTVKAGGSTAIVIASGEEDGLDLAILRVEGLLDKSPLQLHASGEKDHPFIAVGFQLYSKDFLIRPLQGKLGEQVGLEPRGRTNRIRAWDLRIVDDYYLQPGYSGSPVIEKNSGNVLAIVSHRQNEGERGLAISIEAVEKIWSEMPSGLLKRDVHQTFESMETSRNIEVFFSYSEKDKKLRDQLEESLKGLDAIKVWHDGKIRAGQNRSLEIDRHLNSARVILLLISQSFMASDYHRRFEVKRAMERQETEGALVIPVLLRPVANWKSTPFSQLQTLPRNGQFVTNKRYWKNQDEAFFTIAEELGEDIEELCY
jgi:hypothetical protein